MLMRPPTRGLLFAVFLILFAPLLAFGQIPVTDVANLTQNTAQAAQTVLMVLNQVLELTGLDEIIMGEDMAGELGNIQAIMQEAGGLGADVDTILLQLTSLFDLGSAPRRSRELQERLAAIRRLMVRVYVDALRTQTLLQSSLSALRHLVRLIEAIGGFLGNNQANQTLAQMEGQLTIQLTKLKEQTASYHRAQIVDHLAEPLIQESLARMNEALMADWPQ
jgi:hypothetical protein